MRRHAVRITFPKGGSKYPLVYFADDIVAASIPAAIRVAIKGARKVFGGRFKIRQHSTYSIDVTPGEPVVRALEDKSHGDA